MEYVGERHAEEVGDVKRGWEMAFCSCLDSFL
jgi:hypothetical protein